MRRCFLFLIVALLCCGVANGQTESKSYAGIYYYNSASLGVMYRDSAYFYRVVESDNMFNDFYADNSLRATGKIFYLDTKDDSNTLFEGPFTAYYPSGKVWIKQFFKNGINLGDFYEYNEDGSIKEHIFYKDGSAPDNSTSDTFGNNNSDNMVVVGSVRVEELGKRQIERERPNPSEPNILQDSDGNIWRTYAVDGLNFSLRTTYKRYYGRYYLLEVHILNNTPHSVYLNFKKASIASPRGRIKLFSHEKFLRRMKSRHGWANFGLQFATIATAVVLDEVVNGAYYRGERGEWSLGRDIAHDISSILIRQGAAVGSILISAHYSQKMQKVISLNMGYLRNYSIKPNNAIYGFAYAKFNSEAKTLLVNLPIDEKVYQFPVDVSTIRKERASGVAGN